MDVVVVIVVAEVLESFVTMEFAFPSVWEEDATFNFDVAGVIGEVASSSSVVGEILARTVLDSSKDDGSE